MIEQTWKLRIVKAIDARAACDRLSDREMSKRAGLGVNYIEHLRKRDEAQTPRVHELQKMCNFLGLSLVHVLTGLELDPVGEELIRLVADRSEETKRHVIGLLKS